MKVYVVIDAPPYDMSTFIGVFATRELAEREIEDVASSPFRREDYEIIETEVRGVGLAD